MKQTANKNFPSCSTKDQQKLREKELDASFYAANAASATDCTGSVTRGPQSDGVSEAYNQVYHHKPKPVPFSSSNEKS